MIKADLDRLHGCLRDVPSVCVFWIWEKVNDVVVVVHITMVQK